MREVIYAGLFFSKFIKNFRKGRRPHPPHSGTRIRCCRCSLPGLTGFTASRRGGTDVATIETMRILAQVRGD